MPGEDRDGAAVRAPAFREIPGRLLARPLGQAEDAGDAGLDREVARRPDVVPPFGEKQVDLRRPAADALDTDELGDGLLVVCRQARSSSPLTTSSHSERA